ncbi:hypothetical protein BJI67_12255 [Acidihalobacter aeolianus]|uniref:Uncharacterized protein n=1 Tax=Acidihalobacter aeolianus TaxID=2792603 RepID=A0A1D8K9V4_9GAMM|nr:hypothetical protein BJI67_12255 [Acidihalobacter aeolianus]
MQFGLGCSCLEGSLGVESCRFFTSQCEEHTQVDQLLDLAFQWVVMDQGISQLLDDFECFFASGSFCQVNAFFDVLWHHAKQVGITSFYV